jgi:hypothetical protein
MRRVLSVVVLSLILVSGCGTVQRTTAVDQVQLNSRARKVVVLPLVNLTSMPNAGRIVGELLSTEIIAQTDFRMLERSEMMEHLASGKIEVEEVLEKSAAAKVGQSLGVDTVIYGAVTEYRYKKGVDEDPVVGISVKMLDIPETRILWAESVTATGSMYSGRTSLSSLAHMLCADMVRTLASKMK